MRNAQDLLGIVDAVECNANRERKKPMERSEMTTGESACGMG